MTAANCAGMEWESIHPAVCEGCPLVKQCGDVLTEITLDLADFSKSEKATVLVMDGVWGGMSAGQTSTVTLCDSCSSKLMAGGLCSTHYQRAMGRGDGSRSQGAIVLPMTPTRKRTDEPSVAGYQRALKAGLTPTPEQAEAEAKYRREQRT
jgi:hypothetical protein